MSTASRLRAEGRREGRVEGRAEGRAEGRVEVLRTMLEARFGPLPEGVGLRLAAASLEQLDQFAQRVLSATSVNSVFAD